MDVDSVGPSFRAAQESGGQETAVAAADGGGSSRPQCGTLIVCPTSLMHQWSKELSTKVHPSARVLVHAYHGKDKVPSAQALKRCDLCLIQQTLVAGKIGPYTDAQ